MQIPTSSSLPEPLGGAHKMGEKVGPAIPMAPSHLDATLCIITEAKLLTGCDEAPQEGLMALNIGVGQASVRAPLP